MNHSSQARQLDRANSVNVEKNRLELKVNYYIWDGCIEAKWINVHGSYLVNPNFIELFKKRHR